MLMIPLQSGSNGNSIFVEAGGVRLLFDAGISYKQASLRLMQHSIDPSSINALFISHDHSDHVKGVGVFTRKTGLPLYITERTYLAARRRMALGAITDIRMFKAGASVKIGPVTVETIPTPHDAVDGVVFVVDDGKHRLGISTDVGHVFDDLKALVRGVDGLYLESNYDPQMLAGGSYPLALKRRIAGPGGHISNIEAAELLAGHASARLQWVCLAHLSAENNTPTLALETHRALIGDALHIQIARRYEASAPMKLGQHCQSLRAPLGLGFGFYQDIKPEPSAVPSRQRATTADFIFDP